MIIVALFLLTAGIASDAPGKAREKDDFAVHRVPVIRHPSSTGARLDGNWHYHEEKDQLRDSASRLAWIDADDVVEFAMPYGEQRLQMIISQTPLAEPIVRLGVQQGQIMCNSYSKSVIKVRFDRGPIETFGCGSSLDGRNMAFVREPKRFLARIKQSKRLVVEADFVSGGTQQSVFNIASLNWN